MRIPFYPRDFDLTEEFRQIYKYENERLVLKDFEPIQPLMTVDVLLLQKLDARKHDRPDTKVVLCHTVAYNMIKNLSNITEYESYERLNDVSFDRILRRSPLPDMVQNVLEFVNGMIEAERRKYNNAELVHLSETRPYDLVETYLVDYLRRAGRSDPETEARRTRVVIEAHGPKPGTRRRRRTTVERRKRTREPPKFVCFSYYFLFAGHTVRRCLRAIDENPDRYTVNAELPR